MTLNPHQASPKRMHWFHQSRYGMFIHWGLYSILGRGTWVMHNDRLPVSEIETLADQFDPGGFDAEQWALLAADSGMKYAVFTSRHHDGFAMFDSEVSDFTSVKRAAGRDFVAEYVEAFRAAGLKVGLYYSLLDWRFPGYFEPALYPESKEALVEQAHGQVRELLTKYGQIDLLWFDGHWRADVWASLHEYPEAIPPFWRSDQLLEMIRDLQPSIVVNNRTGLAGDYDTPEQSMQVSEVGRAWELCQTIGDWDQAWSHQRFNPSPIRKSSDQLILQLVLAARAEGNLLLNVGPDANGHIPPEEERLVSEVADWMSQFGEAIYGSERSPLPPNAVGAWTFRGNVGYLSFACWPGDTLVVPEIDGEVESVALMGSERPVDYSFDDASGRLAVTGLTGSPPHPAVNVLKVQFADRPKRRIPEDQSSWLGLGRD